MQLEPVVDEDSRAQVEHQRVAGMDDKEGVVLQDAIQLVEQTVPINAARVITLHVALELVLALA
ncbi:MAG: hypothetical protein IIB38_02280 [Candidatus Hydrogenedentes bacterium]|nr:hypothetical protein [Candidatus Hydrogenedentota bacterium]